MGKKKRVCEACGAREQFSNGFFASFPLDENRCKEWVRLCGKEDLAFLPIEKLNEMRFVCGNHFEKWDFNRKGNRLKRNAIPKLKLIAAPLADHVLKDFPLHVASKQVAVQPSLTTSHLHGLPFNSSSSNVSDHAVQPFTSTSTTTTTSGKSLNDTLDKINKINEDHSYNGKLHVDHSYSLEQRRSDIELIAELSDYMEKRYADQPNKDSEGQENSNTTSNDIIAENEDRSKITSKRKKVQTRRRNSADKFNYNSFSNDFDSEKQDGSQIVAENIDGTQIASKRREVQPRRRNSADKFISNSSSNDFDSEKQYGSQINSKSRNNTDGNKSNSNSHERSSATERYTYSFNLTANNVIDVIRTESDITAPKDITASEDITTPEDITAPEEQTCVTDDKVYKFDGDYFDDGVPTVEEAEPKVPEAVFSWQTELNLFPLDDVVNPEDDVLDLSDDAPRPEPALHRPAAPDEALDAEYQCNECQKEITGFRYACVQCADWDLCGACEARGEHVAHYLLRIPSPRPYNEIQTVLAAIRQQLLSENLFLRPEFTDIDWPAEVKEETLGEDSAWEHSHTEDSSDDSDSSGSPRRKRPRRSPRRSRAEHVDLADEVLLHTEPENEQTFSPDLSAEKLPASDPVPSTEIPKDLITSILSSRNLSEVRTHDGFMSLAREKSLGGSSLLKPTQPERAHEDPLRNNGIEHLASISPKVVADNLTEQQTKKTPTNQKCDDLPTITIEDDDVHESVLQPIQQPTLPFNVLRTKAVKILSKNLPVNAIPICSHRITRAQFFDKGFDDNLPAIILEDDEEDQPADRVPQNPLLQPNDPKQLALNSPSRMDIDSSPTVQRVTRSKRTFEKVHNSPVGKSVKNIQKDESLLQTIDGAFQTLDQMIHEDYIVDITEEVADTSRLTEGPETEVLRVPPGSNEAALTQALLSKAIVILEPLQNVIQRITSPRKRLK